MAGRDPAQGLGRGCPPAPGGRPGRPAGVAFAAFGLALAVWGTLSPSIRKAPRLDELDRLAREPLGET